MSVAALASGCIVKKTYEIPVPANLSQDKTASYDELMTIVKADARIQSLSCGRLKATLTIGKVESGRLDEFRRSPGYVYLKRPSLLFLRINNPIGGALLELSSKDDLFEAWFRGKIYSGSNSAKGELTPDNGEEFKMPARPQHLLQAILPPVPSMAEAFVSLEEHTGPKLHSDEITAKQKHEKRQKREAADKARYYVLGFYRPTAENRIHVVRKIWIERAGLTIAKQQFYGEEGRIAGEIQYYDRRQFEGMSLPTIINIDRPAEGYSIMLEFESWRKNPDLQEKDFNIVRPGVETIRLMEKGAAP